jgi:hypothetical protein
VCCVQSKLFSYCLHNSPIAWDFGMRNRKRPRFSSSWTSWDLLSAFFHIFFPALDIAGGFSLWYFRVEVLCTFINFGVFTATEWMWWSLFGRSAVSIWSEDLTFRRFLLPQSLMMISEMLEIHWIQTCLMAQEDFICTVCVLHEP